MSNIIRVQSLIDAVCPDVSVVKIGPASFVLQFSGTETAEQRAAAEAALAGMDLSEEALARWQREQRRQALIASLTSSEVWAMSDRALATILVRQVNALREAMGLPPVERAALVEEWVTVISAGAIDDNLPGEGA